jgi:hypothetical protein
MQDITIRQGSRLSFDVQRADATAVSATFMFGDDEIIVSDTVIYDAEGLAHFQFDSPDTDDIGEFSYQINENFITGSPDIYPNMDNCDGDCDLPKVIICEALPSETS